MFEFVRWKIESFELPRKKMCFHTKYHHDPPSSLKPLVYLVSDCILSVNVCLPEVHYFW